MHGRQEDLRHAPSNIKLITQINPNDHIGNEYDAMIESQNPNNTKLMNKEQQKPKIGQTIYSLNVGNAARNCEQVLTPKLVTKVGRKYFTLGEGWQSTQFYLEGWAQKSEYMSTESLYATELQYAEEKEAIDLCRQLSKSFHYDRNEDSVSLDTLRQIKQLMMKG